MESPEIEILLQRFIQDGIQGLISQLDNKEITGMHRLQTLDAVRQASENIKDVTIPLNMMHDIYDACITYALSIAEGDESLIQYANATSYNLSANLANCWHDDRRPRSPSHFKAGLKAAKLCLKLRTQLNKPPLALAMGQFILGVHHFSLQNYPAAEEAWISKLEYELQTFDDPKQAENNLDVILSHGLISLVRSRLGSCDGKKYEKSLKRLESQRNSDNSGEIDLFKSELILLNEQQITNS